MNKQQNEGFVLIILNYWINCSNILENKGNNWLMYCYFLI